MSEAARLIPYLSVIQQSLPVELRDAAAGLVGRFLAGVQKKRRMVVEKNLSMLGIEDKNELVIRTIRNWTYCVADQMASLWFSKERLEQTVKDGFSRNLDSALAQGKGVVLVTSHLGNYELAGSYLASLGYPVHAVVEEIGGGHTETFLRIRRRFGMEVIPYSDVNRMLEVLRTKKILVLLADRDLGKGGMVLDFAQGRRRVPLGPALLASRTGAVIQTGYFVLDGNHRYRCAINPWFNPADGVRELTSRTTSQLVDALKQYPDQWFCFEDSWEST